MFFQSLSQVLSLEHPSEHLVNIYSAAKLLGVMCEGFFLKIMLVSELLQITCCSTNLLVKVKLILIHSWVGLQSFQWVHGWKRGNEWCHVYHSPERKNLHWSGIKPFSKQVYAYYQIRRNKGIINYDILYMDICLR